MAFLIAKKTDMAFISGGSPVVFDLFITFSIFFPFLKISALNFSGISLTAGILYVEGEWVVSWPLDFQLTSSIVNQPAPWTKPPSIWPSSIAGLIALPASWRISVCVILFSPVNVSIITSLTAAP